MANDGDGTAARRDGFLSNNHIPICDGGEAFRRVDGGGVNQIVLQFAWVQRREFLPSVPCPVRELPRLCEPRFDYGCKPVVPRDRSCRLDSPCKWRRDDSIDPRSRQMSTDSVGLQDTQW